MEQNLEHTDMIGGILCVKAYNASGSDIFHTSSLPLDLVSYMIVRLSIIAGSLINHILLFDVLEAGIGMSTDFCCKISPVAGAYL